MPLNEVAEVCVCVCVCVCACLYIQSVLKARVNFQTNSKQITADFFFFFANKKVFLNNFSCSSMTNKSGEIYFNAHYVLL